AGSGGRPGNTGARPRFAADADVEDTRLDRSRPGRSAPGPADDRIAPGRSERPAAAVRPSRPQRSGGPGRTGVSGPMAGREDERLPDSPPTMIRKRTGPRRSDGDRSLTPRRSGGPLTASMERDFPGPDDVNDLDGADELDVRHGGGGADSMSFLRRLGVALVVLAVALGVGVGAGVVWEKVRPSGRTATDAATAPSPSATAAASAPTAAGPGTSAPASTGQPATGQIAVPADWAPYTDPPQKATFSHPPVWKQRRDNTGIFYGEPGTVSEYGPQMIGVARIAGADQTAALTRVQAGEFDSVSGLTKERSGPATDTSGQPTQELAGSYDREGQRVSYLMRTVSTDGAVYVLIARVSTSAAATLNTLMGALRASFSPAA
ncbi:hypothetical protein, partial [Frankia gtarii]|uniref:hypothetical protein n=1 Tax=Frankia gtarii TaxID=2950102 RepID=UPI0021BFAA6D